MGSASSSRSRPGEVPPRGRAEGIAVATFAAAALLAGVVERERLWGLAAPGEYGYAGLALLAAAALLVFLPGAVDRRIAGALDRLSPRGETAAVLVAAVVLTACGWLARVRVPWLGDQVLWLRSIASGVEVGHLVEPLSFSAALAAGGWLPTPADRLPEGPALLSVLLTAPFVVLSWRLARVLLPASRSGRLWLWVFMIVSPASLFYRGYVESYGLLLLALLAAAALALAARSTAAYAGAMIPFWLGVGFHWAGLGAAPALFAAAGGRLARAIAVSGLAAGVAGVAVWRNTGGKLYALQEKPLAEILLPWGGASPDVTHFLSADHLSGAANVLLLWGGPALFLFPLLRPRLDVPRHRAIAGTLALLAAAGIGGVSLVRLTLGAPRDWDLFGAHLFFLPVLAGWMRARAHGGWGRHGLALLAVALVHGQAWALLDVDRDRSLDRAARLYRDLGVSREAMALTAEELAYLHRIANEHGPAAAWYERAAGAAPGNWRHFNNAGAEYLGMGRLEEAEAMFRAAMERGPSASDPFVNLGALHLEAGKPVEALDAFTRGTARFSGDERLRLGRGLALHRLGRFGEASAALDSVVARRPVDDPVRRLAEDARQRAAADSTTGR